MPDPANHDGATEPPADASRRRSLSIRTRMILYLGAGLVCAWSIAELIQVFGVPGTSCVGQQGQQRAEILRNLELVADLKKDRIVQVFTERCNDIRVSADNAFFANNASRLCDAVQRLEAAGLRDADLWAAVRREPGYGRLLDYLNLIRTSYEVYSRILVVDAATGRVLVSVGDDLVGRDVSSLDAFARNQRPGVTVITDVTVCPHSGRIGPHLGRAVARSAPETGQPEEERAAVVLIFELDAEKALRPIVETGMGLGLTGEVVLLNPDRRIIAPLKHTLPDGSVPRPLEFQSQALPDRLAVRGHEGILEAPDYRGVPVLAACRHIRITPEWGLGLVVKRDQTEVYAPLRRNLAWSFAVSLLAVAGVIGLVIGNARKITGPLLALSRAAARVAHGDLGARAPVTTADEVGALAVTFNTMVGQIQEWHRTLEDQVAARTAELTRTSDDLKAKIAEHDRAEAALRRSESLLKATLQSTADGILVMDEDGKVAHANARFAELWRIPQECLADDDGSLLDRMLDQIEDPGAFLARVRGLHQNPAEDFDTIRLKDGRFFEHFSCPLIDNGLLCGRVWSFRDVTRRRQAEEDLRSNEARYRELANSIGDVFFAMDKDLRYTFWNKASETLTGVAASDAIGKSLFDVFPDVRGTEIEQLYRDVLRTQQPQRRIQRYCVRNREAFFEISAYPSRDGISVFAEDVTDSRRAEEALQAERNLVSAILETSGALIVVLDRTGRIVRYNRTCEQITGYAADEATGEFFWDMVLPADEIETVKAEFSRLRPGSFPHRHETHWIARDGTRRLISWTDTALLDGDGAIRYVVATGIDITERQKTEILLRKLHTDLTTQYRGLFAIFEGFEGAVYVADLNTHELLYANSYLTTRYGNVVGRKCWQVLQPHLHGPCPFCTNDQLLSPDGQPAPPVIRENRNPQTGRWWQSTDRAIRWPDGRLVRMEIAIDITDRKQAEEELKRTNAELKQKNAEMERFVYTVSHDLKSPLITIQGFVGHLKRDIDAGRIERLTDFAGRILGAITRTRQLIDGLLELSRVGRVSRQPEWIPMGEFLDGILQNHEEQLAERHIQTHRQPDMPVIHACPSLVAAVFDNLIVNAILHGSTAPNPQIVVGVQEDGEYYRFYVRDNGPGVAEEQQERIFEVFQRLSTDPKGSGVGLAIVKRAVELLEGHVRVESRPGEGATFWVAIPMRGTVEQTSLAEALA